MVGTEHDHRLVVESLRLEYIEQLAEPVVDHREARSVAGPDLARLGRRQLAPAQRSDRVGRPDELRPLPVGVVARGPGLGRVEGLVRIELVDEEQEALVAARVVLEPVGGRRHGLRPREVRLLAEPGARDVVGARAGRRSRLRDLRSSERARVGHHAPGVVLAAAHVLPGVEVGVIVLASRLEQMRMVGDEHGGDAGRAQVIADRLLPELDRAPGLPEEVERAAQDVVTRGHAGERARVVALEAQRSSGEAIDVGRVEFPAPVAAEEVAIQAIEEHDDGVSRRHPATSASEPITRCSVSAERAPSRRSGPGRPASSPPPAPAMPTTCASSPS